MDDYLTEDELAKQLKVSRSFLWALRTKQGLPHIRIGRTVRYEPQAVTEWLKVNDENNNASNGKQEGEE